MSMKEIRVEELVEIVGPGCEMLGPLKDGGRILSTTEPACCGPMFTPELKGGHTVTRPVGMEGAEVGDAIAITIKRLRMLSTASASGTDRRREGYYVGDPFIAKRCPSCGEINPRSYVEGIGRDAVKCAKCKIPIRAFEITCGYTALFSRDREIGVTVPAKTAASIAMEADRYAAPPKTRKAHSVLRLALADMPPGIVMRLIPSIGNIGTVPAVDIPSSHNCGDLGQLLVGAPHAYGIRKEDLTLRTDAHMDLATVREGATVIAPVKVEGGGIYMGDINAAAGGGLVAGHSLDVSGEISVDVEVIKGLEMEGPVVLPNEEDLPFLSRPFKKREESKARELAREHGFELEELAPVQVVGSGPTLNDAVNSGVERIARLVGMRPEEVKNRATVGGGIEIGRVLGLVGVSVLLPVGKLEDIGIAHLI